MAMLCARCGEQVVHEKRDFNLCLDCLIEMLIKQGSLEIPKHYEASIFGEKMIRQGKCQRCGGKERKFRYFGFCRCDKNHLDMPMINEYGQFLLDAWKIMLTPEEIQEAVYVHGTTAIEGNTLDIEDCFELLYGDKQTVIDKYEWGEGSEEKIRKAIQDGLDG